MAFSDKQIGWRRKRVFLGPHEHMGILGASGVSTGAQGATVTLEEIGALGVTGIVMVTTEAIGGMFKLPYDFDPKFDMGWRALYTSTFSSGTPAFTWTILYGLKKATVLAAPTTALDTAIAAQNYLDAAGAAGAASYLPQVSPRGIIKASTMALSHQDIDDNRTWAIFKNTLTYTGSDTVYYLGIEIDYVPQRCVGTGMVTAAPLDYKGQS